MRFSIITICKNDKRRLIQTIDSVNAQTSKDYEHIIQDGCSTDGTGDYLKKQEGICRVKVFSENDNGIYDAMNRAAQKATGDFICFLNAGDLFASDDVLTRVEEHISFHPDGEIFYGDAITIFPNGMENSQVIALNPDKLASDEVQESVKQCLIHQSIFTKRNIFDEDGFDCEYKLRAELEWYYRCFHKHRIWYRMPFAVCKYTLGGLSESSMTAEQNILETKQILQKYGYSIKRYEDGLSRSHLVKGVYKYIYNEWLSLKLSGYSMETALRRRGVRTVAVFGYGEIGCHVIQELKGSSIAVEYLIESNYRHPYAGIPIIHPDDISKATVVDMIIVTAIMRFDEVKKMYASKTKSPFISLEYLLEEMWESNN